jgi:hypothetical protein
MVVSDPFDGWGNKLIQYCFGRVLGSTLNYYVSCRRLPGIVNSGDWNVTKERVTTPVVDINHHSKYRHYVDIDELKALAPGQFNVRSYLEYYPNLENYRDAIREDWCYISNPYQGDNLKDLSGRFKKYNGNTFVPVDVDNIGKNDLVISIRLGRDYLGQHRMRLLLGDYFRIVLDRVDYDRLFITSQDPYNDILADLYRYDPIFLDHISALHTFNFVRLFNKIVLSQSTYSWWAAYLSEAKEIYFPITKDGPWSYGKDQRAKWKDYNHDLMVNEDRYSYVSYIDECILGDYKTTRAAIL